MSDASGFAAVGCFFIHHLCICLKNRGLYIGFAIAKLSKTPFQSKSHCVFFLIVIHLRVCARIRVCGFANGFAKIYCEKDCGLENYPYLCNRK